MKVVFISGPFRSTSAWGIECNIREAEKMALCVWEMGAAALCPHTNTRFFQGALPDEIWLLGDLALLSKCDAVLLLPAWHGSEGARAEKEYAERMGIPIFKELHLLKDWIREQDGVSPAAL